MLKISHQFQSLTSTLYNIDANGTPFKQSVPRLVAIVVGPLSAIYISWEFLEILRDFKKFQVMQIPLRGEFGNGKVFCK